MPMSKIESLIELECYDWKPSDIEWMLRKEDVALIAENIKKQLIQEIKDSAEHVDDAVRCVESF
jgi:hypothetical protein